MSFMIKKVVSLFVILCLLIPNMSAFAHQSKEFSAENYIEFIKSFNIINGDPDGNYRLDDLVTRAEFSKIAVAASKSRNMVASSLKISPFKDVSYKHWAAPYIKVALTNKYVNGYEDSTFRPDSTVLYEEAVTIFLKLLGYTNDDFGSSWPYGPMGIAQNIDLVDNIDLSIGSFLTRKDAITLVYNLLNCKMKDGSNSEYMSVFDCALKENIILIATSNEDSSVGANKIATSESTYEIGDYLNLDYLGKKGNAIIKENDTMVAFIPNTEYTTEKYAVYSVLDNKVIVLDNSQFKELTFKDGLDIYEGSNKSTFSQVKSKLDMGDEITVRYDDFGAIDYLIYNEGTLIGPVTVTNSAWASNIGANVSTSSFVRDGVKCASGDIKTNDIVYYNKGVDMVLAYSKKVTGVYENASPNRDNPSSIEISGTTYDIESASAYNKLSAAGNFKYGDTITVFLGKDGKIADVSVAGNISTSIVGYLTDAGSKIYKDSDGNDYSSFFAKVVTTDGKENEYKTDKNYSSFKNLAVNVTFTNGEGKITKASNPQTLGVVKASKMMIGSTYVSENAEILDVGTIYEDEPTLYKNVYLQRLDGLSITSSNTLYVEKNASGEITKMILKDVTGDVYTYAITASVKTTKDGDGNVRGYSYTFDSNGSTYTDNGRYLPVSASSGARLSVSGGKIDTVKALFATEGKVSDLTGEYIIAQNVKYKLSDDVIIYSAVYDGTSSTYKYLITPIDTAIEKLSDYKSITAYYDKDESKGGRVRIIVVREK
ncbi:MAG: S-layer homology domain-containing protein [Ruminococcaceae bacterium]|nr:S-layer homology domain-containing protein [Oscillospiraceae bacterium]